MDSVDEFWTTGSPPSLTQQHSATWPLPAPTCQVKKNPHHCSSPKSQRGHILCKLKMLRGQKSKWTAWPILFHIFSTLPESDRSTTLWTKQVRVGNQSLNSQRHVTGGLDSTHMPTFIPLSWVKTKEPHSEIMEHQSSHKASSPGKVTPS